MFGWGLYAAYRAQQRGVAPRGNVSDSAAITMSDADLSRSISYRRFLRLTKSGRQNPLLDVVVVDSTASQTRAVFTKHGHYDDDEDIDEEAPAGDTDVTAT